MLTERDPSLIGLRIGVTIGEKLGWSEKQSAYFKAERKALDAEFLRASPHAPTYSCEWSAQTEEWLQGVMKHGEAGYLRQRLAQQAGR